MLPETQISNTSQAMDLACVTKPFLPSFPASRNRAKCSAQAPCLETPKTWKMVHHIVQVLELPQSNAGENQRHLLGILTPGLTIAGAEELTSAIVVPMVNYLHFLKPAAFFPLIESYVNKLIQLIRILTHYRTSENRRKR